MNIYQEAHFSSKSYHFVARYMAFSPTNSVCALISVEHARKQSLSTILCISYKLSCSQALCAHMRADYARARILYTMMLPGHIEPICHIKQNQLHNTVNQLQCPMALVKLFQINQYADCRSYKTWVNFC